MATNAATQAAAKRLRVVETATIPASADKIYNLLADYKNGHPKILPKENFSDLVVEKGGVGAGTVITFKAGAWGMKKPGRMVVSEPEPGLLMERDDAQGLVTTFRVTAQTSSTAQLEIATELPVKPGVAGALEKFMVKSMLTGIYRKELKIIQEYFQNGGN